MPQSEARLAAVADWLLVYLGRGWHYSAEVKEAGAERGFNPRVLRRAGERIGMVYARTPTVPSRTLWGNGDDVLRWLEERSTEPESEQETEPRA